MRIPITVYSAPSDIETVQPAINAAQQSFADYLDHVPRKSTKSKHGLMGPVGKIFSEIKSGRRDPNSLKGYAVRVHEATGRRPSSSSLANLETAIDTIVKLLNEAPVAFHLGGHLKTGQSGSPKNRPVADIIPGQICFTAPAGILASPVIRPGTSLNQQHSLV